MQKKDSRLYVPNTHTSLLTVVCVLFFWIGCSGKDGTIRYSELTLIASYPLDISDPSGLSFSVDRNALWTVSDDRGGGIYRISFTGNILERLDYSGDDLEGITVNPVTRTIFVVEERLREVRELNKRGEILRIKTLDIPGENPNDGLEGITINPERDELYVVNEKNPMLFIRMALADLSVLDISEVNFFGIYAITDVSGVFFDEVNDEIWLLSDESAKIVVTDINLQPQRAYLTGLSKGEGLVVDVDQNRIYIVNDDSDELYVFQY